MTAYEMRISDWSSDVCSSDLVWFESGIAVEANTTYFFSTWIASTYPVSPAQLHFSINGASIGPTFVASSTPGEWQQFFASWNSGANTTADIALVNPNPAFSGTDSIGRAHICTPFTNPHSVSR